MRMAMRAAFAATALLLPAAASAATVVQINSYAFSDGARSGTLHGPGPFNGAGVGIGRFKLTGVDLATSDPVSYLTYCIDIMHALFVPGQYNVVPIAQLTPALSSLKQAQIGALLSNTPAVTSTDISAGIQLAVWEIGFESAPSYDVNAGGFSVTGGNSAAARALANGYLAQLPGWTLPTGLRTLVLDSAANQDQTFLAPVPEPGIWAMLIAGFGAVGAALRRRRLTVGSIRVRQSCA